MVQQLSSRERAFLRKLAHNLEPVVRIGKEGIDENLNEFKKQLEVQKESIKMTELGIEEVDTCLKMM